MKIHLELINTKDKFYGEKLKFVDSGFVKTFNELVIDVYLWKALGGSKVTTEHAKNLLAKKFTTPPTSKSKKNNETIVLLVDELGTIHILRNHF